MATSPPARSRCCRKSCGSMEATMPPLRGVVHAAGGVDDDVLLNQTDERWQDYWIDDGPESRLLFYCPECAEREFGRA